MEEQIQLLVENTNILDIYKKLSKEELQVIRMFINLKLIYLNNEDENQPKIRMITTCFKYKYNFLDNILNCRYNIDRNISTDEYSLKIGKDYKICLKCKCSKCIKYTIPYFMNIINSYNKENKTNLKYIDVIDYLLQRKVPNFKEVPEPSFFNKFNIIDLMYAHVILEADLIRILAYEKENSVIEAEYLDLTEKKDNNYFINDIINFYRNEEKFINIKISITNIEEILKEKNFYLRIYKITVYFKYLIEIEKIDVIAALRKLLEINNIKNGLKIRAHYYIHKQHQSVNKLPCTKKTKEKILDIFNYILNYKYKNNVVYVPINIAIYTEDRAIAELISFIIYDFMYFFNYFPTETDRYCKFIDKILLDKSTIKNIYYDNGREINGMLLLHNIEDLLLLEDIQRKIMLGNLAIEIEKHNENVCTVIYGNKKEIHKLFENNQNLSQILFNVEIDVDNMNEENIYKMIIHDFEEITVVSDDVKEKLRKYINSSYKKSELKDIAYAEKLYNSIVLKHNSKFDFKDDTMISIDDIPEPINEKD